MFIKFRTYVVLKTGRATNAYTPDGSDVSPFVNRLSRAHANCYESFPFIGGILLYAIASGTAEVTNSMALWLLGARIAQSVTHLLSGAANLCSDSLCVFYSVNRHCHILADTNY